MGAGNERPPTPSGPSSNQSNSLTARGTEHSRRVSHNRHGGVRKNLRSFKGTLFLAERVPQRKFSTRPPDVENVLHDENGLYDDDRVDKGEGRPPERKDDDVRIGGARSVLMMLRVFSGITGYYVFSVAALVAWTCVCAWGADHLRERAGQDPGGRVEAWLGWIEEIEVKVIGSLFTFSLVFRFNQCYRRWWQGRELWGGIVQQCLDFSEKVSLWIIDKDYSDRLNRLIIVFPYACKAQLRGLSLADPTESGASLVRRGLLTEAELRYLDKWPCWQPEFFLDFMRTIISHVFLAEYDRGDVLMIPKSNKIHEKLFSPLEKCVYDLGKSIGDCISIRSAGLPKSYDFVHYVFYW
eukprot:CAMPEP_0113598836 /NCGR_PEP_ID=MMETSP0015_2-20120614/41809_1 /TAXON_ID=2838 /ORGANISM="Odontella" /LENGTH=352 /DNA_ID=CAMNT_0000506899 /DNA_START=233 /DNA_END=1289 /DNA_ORIENTATION=- /assembly_acc=CAM_ASM_000160